MPLKVREAEAPRVVVTVNVPLLVYLTGRVKRKDGGGGRDAERIGKTTHEFQKGSAVDPSFHAQLGEYSIAGLKSSKVTFTV